jgi:hypothetical protein
MVSYFRLEQIQRPKIVSFTIFVPLRKIDISICAAA